MSEIIYSNTLIPSNDVSISPFTSEAYKEKLYVEKSKALPFDVKDAELPDSRAYRTMSRTSVLLSLICLDVQKYIAEYIDNDPFSIGIYCAVENGPVDCNLTQKMRSTENEAFAHQYKRLHNPKLYLKKLPNLAAVHVGIHLKSHGPIHVFSHSTHGSIHALEHAEFDLIENNIKIAIVCTAFSFENPLMVERNKKIYCTNGKIHCEGAGVIVLMNNGLDTCWNDNEYSDKKYYYGISDPIIQLAQKREEKHEHYSNIN